MKATLLAATAFTSLSLSAFAADLPSRAAPAPILTQKDFSWSGAYVGVTAGAVGLTNNSDYNASTQGGYGVGGYADDGYFANGSGGGSMLGATIGYNHQLGSIVVGLEGDFSLGKAGVSASGVNNDGYVTAAQLNMKSFGTLRLRTGVAFDRTLVYVTGGLAIANMNEHLSNSYQESDNAVNASGMRKGWVVGAGVEHALTNNLSLKIEGLYANLKTKVAVVPGPGACDGCRSQFKTNATVGRVGLNYKF